MSSEKRLTRRQFLNSAFVGAAGIVAASCVASPAAPVAAPAATTAPVSTAVPPAPAPTAVPPAPAPATIEFWETWGTSAAFAQAEKDVFDAFVGLNPGIKVNFVEVPFEQSHEKIVTAFAANSGPDVFQATGAYYAEFSSSGYVHPLDEYLGKVKEDIVPIAILDAVYQGQMMFLPMHYDIYMQYYRKDILDEAGLTYPETMDQLLEAGLKLTDAKKPLYMFPVRGNRHTHFMVFNAVLSRTGGGVDSTLFDENGKCVINSDEGIEAYQWWGDLLMKHKISPPTSPTDLIPETRQQFFSGTLATHWDFMGALPGYLAALKPEQVLTAPLPTGPKGNFHAVGGNGYYISKESKVKDAAWALLEYAFEPENASALCKGAGSLPTNRLAFEADWLTAPVFKMATDTLAQPERLLRSGSWLPEFPQFATEIAINNTTNFLLGKATAKESLDAQAAFLEAAQARYLKG